MWNGFFMYLLSFDENYFYAGILVNYGGFLWEIFGGLLLIGFGSSSIWSQFFVDCKDGSFQTVSHQLPKGWKKGDSWVDRVLQFIFDGGIENQVAPLLTRENFTTKIN
jgi:hypothetical protein